MTSQHWIDFGLALFIAMGGPVLVGNVVVALLRARGLNNAADWVTTKAPLVLAALAKNHVREADIARGVTALKGSQRNDARIAGLLLEAHLPPAELAKKDPEPPAVAADLQSVAPPALMPPMPPTPRAPSKMPPWTGGTVLCLVLGGCVPILGCQFTPAQQAQAGKVLEASVDAGLELADHVCEASGRHSGFVEFLCTFVGSLTEDTGKADMVELGPDRKPIKVSVPDAMAEDFGRRHSPEQLARRE